MTLNPGRNTRQLLQRWGGAAFLPAPGRLGQHLWVPLAQHLATVFTFVVMASLSCKLLNLARPHLSRKAESGFTGFLGGDLG